MDYVWQKVPSKKVAHTQAESDCKTDYSVWEWFD